MVSHNGRKTENAGIWPGKRVYVNGDVMWLIPSMTHKYDSWLMSYKVTSQPFIKGKELKNRTLFMKFVLGYSLE